ncbi:MAG: helix-turn-helix domain-containing protein [Pseudomonadota bacterium]
MQSTPPLPILEHPDEAFAAVAALRHMADTLERASVIKALEQGWTWAQIAEALGISKQAAHKRHAGFIHQGK